MVLNNLDGKMLSKMVIFGARNLTNNVEYVDALNVFPVPDGDTGTNMNLTITSGRKEVELSTSNHVGEVAGIFAKGLLMGARGNSGVILSQLFRGFSRALEGKATVDAKQFAAAFDGGVVTAYKAVMKPVEGTILTVAKDSAKVAVETAEKTDDIIVVMEAVVKEAKASLDRTPDLLPVLKEVGVVDSGGQGLLTVYEGFLAKLKGEELPEGASALSMEELVSAEHHKSVQSHMSTEDIEYGYCTEFMVKFEEDKLNESPFNEEEFRNTLSNHGDSLLVVADDEIVKVHIHAEHPGEVLTYAQKHGSLINMKIENMREQHTTILESDKKTKAKKPKEKANYGVVTVAMGDGIADLFKSLGANEVIKGGQTMNPSTEDIVKSIKEAHAETVFILPNNSNIVMAAKQAAEVADARVIVIPTKTVPQGMAALLSFNPAQSPEENEASMLDGIANVKTGQVTFAVRDTSIDGVEIKENDFMGIADGKIVVSHSDMEKAAQELLSNLIDEDDEIVTIIQGEDASDKDVDALVSYVEEKFEDVEVEVHKGEQPLYAYIISVE
ncbi:hypothetical protein CIB95_03050 [Lottiidibacillus patelloidae]|uniref:DhaL domain-containing protein n=1 Tax=Lottiidibacillus patelloidae TaxID=2670334 RepID=A0A263BXR8_9BACI|nr:DAK2 domain-containing protein [Lottiidibacillus patelloidae]OZM58561.1 hypothetical protein CIB95_03050 [Lottiidibacillus patelloidae]